MSNRNLSRRLDETAQATQHFLEEYTSNMQLPVNVLNTTLNRISQAQNPSEKISNLEIFTQTLRQMDNMLYALMISLEATQTQ